MTSQTQTTRQENPFTVQSQGEYRYANGRSAYVVTGYTIRRFEGTGTAFETVGRPLHPSEMNTWGDRKELLWSTKDEAEIAAARVNTGDKTEISFSSYSND